MPTRIACVRYLNTSVLIEGLSQLPEIALIPTVPSRIAEMVRAGEADIGLVSLIDAMDGGGKSGGGLTLLPVGMIGCDGPTLTVRVYSSTPLEQVRRIHADTDSHTSVALARVIMRQRHGVNVGITAFNAREQMPVWLRSGGRGSGDRGAGAGDGHEDGCWPEAMLLIGDKVVTDSPPAVRYPYQMDLGEAWKGLTGLPFVYAVWACRTGEEGRPEVLHGAAMLDRQLRHNMTRIDWIITRRAGEHRWPLDLARRYLGELLRFAVGDRERLAAERFVSLAREIDPGAGSAGNGGAIAGSELRWGWAPGERVPAVGNLSFGDRALGDRVSS
jgi:chorismate dehydratase